MTAPQSSPEPDDTVDKMVERVSHDLEHIQRWSMGLDLRIVWLTVFGRGVRQNAY